MGDCSRVARIGYVCLFGIFLLVMYLPIGTILVASFSKSRYFKFPIPEWSMKWYVEVIESLSIREFFWTSLIIAILVSIFATGIAFFGALAFARYRWRGRKLFQKIVILPILFPQAVLGLALLLWFNSVGIMPSWRTAVFAHLVWITPITTLVITIQVYSFDPAMEEAAFDLGASRWQVMREVTLPILAPGLMTGLPCAFLLSWANFPLSMLSTGADSTLPEWMSAKVQSGYTPQVPAAGALTMLIATVIIFAGYLVMLSVRQKRIVPAEGV